MEDVWFLTIVHNGQCSLTSITKESRGEALAEAISYLTFVTKNEDLFDYKVNCDAPNVHVWTMGFTTATLIKG